MADHRFTAVGLGYICEWPKLGVWLSLDRVHRSRDGLTAEVQIELTGPPHPGHLHQARLAISSTSARKSLASYLETRTNGLHLDWPGLLEVACVSVLRAEREGQPFVRVGRLDAQVEERWCIEGLLPDGKTTIFYGDGGSLKSFTAVAVAVSIASGETVLPGFAPASRAPVLYLDWESDSVDLNARVRMVCAGAGIKPVEIGYRACVGPLADQVEEVARYVHSEHVGLLVVDSVGMATAGGEAWADASDAAIRLFAAVRACRTTALCIDHVTNEGRERKGVAGRPYGSAYKTYLARMSYEFKRAKSGPPDSASIALYNQKRNRGALAQPVGFHVTFGDEAIRFQREGIEEPDLVAGLALGARLWWALGDGPQSVHWLAEQMETTEAVVRTRLNRRNRTGSTRFVKIPDGRWARAAIEDPSGAPADTSEQETALPW